ncbi:MAG: hypothetical protein IJM32_06620 [Ruminococcus sp.]|nr:hypothetical protein [Ruminococcus sp.]
MENKVEIASCETLIFINVKNRSRFLCTLSPLTATLYNIPSELFNKT